jgi:hypothetical protein
MSMRLSANCDALSVSGPWAGAVIEAAAKSFLSGAESVGERHDLTSKDHFTNPIASIPVI